MPKTKYKDEIWRFWNRNRKRKSPWMFTCWAIIVLVVILSILVCVSLHVPRDLVTDAYLGSIIGGAISGTLTYIGVVFTIHFYKRSELQNEIDRMQPSFYCKTKHYGAHEVSCYFTYEESCWNCKNTEPSWRARIPVRHTLEFSNMGSGMAFLKELTIEGHNSSQTVSFLECYAIKESFCVEVTTTRDFDYHETCFLLFSDADDNEYIQEIGLFGNAPTMYIKNTSPVLKDVF